ncbi:MAG: bifunctional diaminohydroxyphosphoribosylaminopyrimidine deaminase/5-amino-6-(5-phosphoribosylamino)uracil reductase RibD [Flavobacteriales bacterium]
MADHDRWMHRCLQLGRLGAGGAAPNPMVGALLVQDERVLAEGWHKEVGGPHAEVECLRDFGPQPIPGDAVMYVNLEPCSHQGRTPPCADLLIERGVRHVVIANADPFPEVSGRGIERLRAAGVDVITGPLEAQARWLNRRFLTSIEQGRPYIILKWAHSSDGFLDDHGKAAHISSPETDVLVHKWRSEEQAILVGSRTVINDDPQLTVRHIEGRSPLRIVIDRENRAPKTSKLFDGSAPTLLITNRTRGDVDAEQHVIGTLDDPIDALMGELHRRSIRSLLVEGGAELLMHFIERGAWDEARVITGAPVLGSGTAAPTLAGSPARSTTLEGDRIDFHVRTGSAFSTACATQVTIPW